jgi:hypoxanthine-DNA glycosylase
MLTCPVCKTLLPEGICFCARCKCEFVKHTFAPVFANDSRILILGTIPSPKSREVCFYYGHNGNRFWKIMSVLYNSAVETIADKTKLILDNRLALWDVLASCWIKGAKDDSIIQPEPNDFSRLLTLSKIERVLCTGTKAFCLYQNS